MAGLQAPLSSLIKCLAVAGSSLDLPIPDPGFHIAAWLLASKTTWNQYVAWKNISLGCQLEIMAARCFKDRLKKSNLTPAPIGPDSWELEPAETK